jgi:hypothetical protein
VAGESLQVDPAGLRLPPSRKQGADPLKLQKQIAKHGKSVDGMPPLWVSRGKDGELMILDGVTRATRAAKLLPGQTLAAEVVDDEPARDYSKLPKVGDQLP